MAEFTLPNPNRSYTEEGMKLLQLAMKDFLGQSPNTVLDIDDIRLIGGFDVQQCEGQLVGAIVVFDRGQHIRETVIKVFESTVPYIPGYLAFRELPGFLCCLEELKSVVDLFVFDGYGLLHPRRMGLARQASLYIDQPTFGIAKSPYVGTYSEPNPKRGSWTPIMVGDEIMGIALRTQDNTKPVFISIGSGVLLQTCTEISLWFSKFRVPELTRQPDLLARKHCRELQSLQID